VFIPDEVMDLVAADEFIRAKLGARADEIAAVARRLSLDEIVGKVLHRG